VPENALLRLNVIDDNGTHPDDAWFEQHPDRAHRTRLPLLGEPDDPPEYLPRGVVRVAVIRQIMPRARLRRCITLPRTWWIELPDLEAVAHFLFEVACQREPPPLDFEMLLRMAQRYVPKGSAA
jgi:hypothetical protein